MFFALLLPDGEGAMETGSRPDSVADCSDYDTGRPRRRALPLRFNHKGCRLSSLCVTDPQPGDPTPPSQFSTHSTYYCSVQYTSYGKALITGSVFFWCGLPKEII